MIPASRIPSRILRVLVVDDHHDAADSLALLLRMLGHEVRTVYDGSSALDECCHHRIDVAFIDLAMPGMTGYALVKHLRSQSRPTPPTLVALSGFADLTSRRAALQSGFDHFFAKPMEFAELEQLLANLPRRSAQFKLYVAGSQGKASQAVANLQGLCEQEPLLDYHLEVIDVCQSPETAEQDHIIRTPCLVYESGQLRLRVVGDLGDRDRLLDGLGWGVAALAEPTPPAEELKKRRRRRPPAPPPPEPARPHRMSLPPRSPLALCR